jgi:cyclase
MLRAGADKCAINTAAIRRPELVSEIAQVFGSQCMVLGVEAKRTSRCRWECFTDNGREYTGLDVIEWCRRGYELGAGEIMLTSVDQEGTRKGLDLALIEAVAKVVPIPIIASGGVGSIDHMVEGYLHGADAIAIADMLHYNRATLPELRAAAIATEMGVRQDARVDS